MLSPTAASVSFSSSGGSLWLNSTCGAVWLARRPSLNSYKHNRLNNSHKNYLEFQRFQKQTSDICLLTCMKTLPMMTSSSSLNTVLKTTVTLSFLASTYLKKPEEIRQIRMTAKVSECVIRLCCSYAYMDSSSL